MFLSQGQEQLIENWKKKKTMKHDHLETSGPLSHAKLWQEPLKFI